MKKLIAAVIGCMALMFVLFISDTYAAAGGEGLRIYHIDLGSESIKGDAVLLESEGEFVLIDTGMNDPEDHVVNFLQDKGVKELSVVISHFHGDHFGEINDLIKAFTVSDLYTHEQWVLDRAYEYCETSDEVGGSERIGLHGSYDKYTGLQAKSGLKNYPLFHECMAGDEIKFGNATIKVLGVPSFNVNDFKNDHDLDPELTETALEHYLNNMSLCTMTTVISDGIEYRYLSCGDAEVEEENWLMSRGIDLKSDIYKMDHHGTDTSNSEEFIGKVKPLYSVANHYVNKNEITRQNLVYDKLGIDKLATKEAADNNLYGLTRTYETMKRAEKFGEVYRTEFNGDVSFDISGGDIQVDFATGFRTLGGKTFLYDDNELVSGKDGFITGYCNSLFAVEGNGELKSGVFTYKGKQYKCTGAHGMAEIGEGFYEYEGKTYYTAPYTCCAATGWVMIDGNRYYFLPKTGEMAKNAVVKVEKGKYIYFTKKGLQYKKGGWVKVGGSKYYITDGAVGTGKVYTGGWLKIDGKYYYFAKNGKLTDKKAE